MKKDLINEAQATTRQNISNRIRTEIPEHVMQALNRFKPNYSIFEHVFHCIEIYPNTWAGVVGSGDMGCYETFYIDSVGTVQISDVGYGQTTVALRNVLTEHVEI